MPDRTTYLYSIQASVAPPHFPKAPKQRRSTMRKLMLVALALLSFACLGFGTASAQFPGGVTIPSVPDIPETEKTPEPQPEESAASDARSRSGGPYAVRFYGT